MQANSLQNVMNDVSRRLGSGDFSLPVTKALSELEAFARLDPLLADLDKQYRDTQDMYLQAKREFGVDDPMTEMALLNEDSAWCAVQTRYMELRADREKMRHAQRLMEDSRIEEERLAKAKRQKELLEDYDRMKFFSDAMARRHKNDAGEFFFMIYLLILQKQTHFYPAHTQQFNQLAA